MRAYKNLTTNILSQVESPNSPAGYPGNRDEIYTAIFPGTAPVPEARNTKVGEKKKKQLHGTEVKIAFYLINSCQFSRNKSQFSRVKGKSWVLSQSFKCLLLSLTREYVYIYIMHSAKIR